MLALHAQEQMRGAYRKTWVVFASTALLSGVMAFLPLLLILFLPPLFFAIPQALIFLGLFLWWWVVWIVTFQAFTDFYLDVFVITNERIINIEQLRPFNRIVSELRLERVQDVTVEQAGILPTLLQFGTIRVQSAGEAEAFVFTSIPSPMRVKEAIMAACREALRKTPDKDLGAA